MFQREGRFQWLSERTRSFSAHRPLPGRHPAKSDRDKLVSNPVNVFKSIWSRRGSPGGSICRPKDISAPGVAHGSLGALHGHPSPVGFMLDWSGDFSSDGIKWIIDEPTELGDLDICKVVFSQAKEERSRWRDWGGCQLSGDSLPISRGDQSTRRNKEAEWDRMPKGLFPARPQD